jgi:hypothetical protein
VPSDGLPRQQDDKMPTVAILIASILAVTVAAICANSMLDVVKIAETRGPTVAVAGFTVRLGIVAGIIAALVWAWSTSF